MWYFIDTGGNTAAWNMAFDEALVECSQSDPSFSVVRVFGWKPWAISIGYSQKARHDFLIEKIGQAGYGFVRRATGGRAVFHAEELTYSVIARPDTPHFGSNLHDTYRVIGRSILRSLEIAGFTELRLERSKSDESSSRDQIARPCFSSTARYEITWKGRKVAGSAQKRTKTTVQQHGSLLLGNTYLDVVNFMNLGEEERESYKRDMQQNAVALSEIAGREVTYEQIARVFSKGFEEVFGQELKLLSQSKGLKKRTNELTEKKYSNEKWNFRF